MAREGRNRGPVRRLGRGVALAGILSLAAAPATRAQEPGPLVTDRPDRTESAETVAAGLVQVEAGWTFAREEEGDLEVTSHSLPETLIRVGLAPWLEGRVGIAGWQSVETEAPTASSNSSEGFGDAFVGAKVRLVEADGSRPAVALLGSLSLPVGEEGLGSERADPGVRASVAHDLPGGLSLGWNVGVEWETGEDDVAPAGSDPSADGSLVTQSDLIYTVAVGIPVGARVGAFVEAFGALGVQEARPDRHSLDGGLTYLIADNLQLDASAGVGLAEAADDFFVGAGLSVRLPR